MVNMLLMVSGQTLSQNTNSNTFARCKEFILKTDLISPEGNESLHLDQDEVCVYCVLSHMET